MRDDTEKNEGMFVICTGTYYESPDYCGDESDWYGIGIERTKFFGTIEAAKEKARALRAERGGEYDRNLVSVYSWIYDSNGDQVI